MVVLTLSAVQNSSSTFTGRYATPASAAALLCGVALLVPRVPWPVAPALGTAAAGWWGWPLLPLLLLALFDLSARRRAWLAAGCAVLALAANIVTRPASSLWTPQPYGSSLFLIMVVVVGLWIGKRRQLVADLNLEVDHLRLERQLREQAARAAERAHIAAEMHDVLAHRLSLIALHSGALAARSASLPDSITSRLTVLRTTSTEALADLRDVLGALRDPDADRSHAPVLRDVGEVIEQARTGGQQIQACVRGVPDQVPAAHQLAVYRLVQEALTNARKHAHGAPVDVHIDYLPPDASVLVTNQAGRAGIPAVSSGFGLVGLRERVTALGGTLQVGPAGQGTWRLSASLPQHHDSEHEDTP
ncbi:two-component sensor histidine kinase [Actinocatenispora thailandica]|uniref:histidine kinase n=1 Tax=Actinocatenispora thailandica TaxID=227318 RepID=A0A7R7I0J7_9ACTN|nr:two-component sensor histidine kinase [Actinocatenispora thailandica]